MLAAGQCDALRSTPFFGNVVNVFFTNQSLAERQGNIASVPVEIYVTML